MSFRDGTQLEALVVREMNMRTKVVGLPLVGMPLRPSRALRDGTAASAGPTQQMFISRLGEESNRTHACGRAAGFFAKPQNDTQGTC